VINHQYVYIVSNNLNTLKVLSFRMIYNGRTFQSALTFAMAFRPNTAMFGFFSAMGTMGTQLKPLLPKT